MKKLSWLFLGIAILLSDIMCFVVAYNYRSLICCIEHTGCSAPSSISFYYAIPFLILIVIFILLFIKFYKK